MELAESSQGVGLDHADRLGHREARSQVAPGLRAQVVAPEDQVRLGQPDVRRGRPDLSSEIPRGHARVAAVLIYLIAGSLDNRHLAAIPSKCKPGVNNHRVRAAERVHASGAAQAVLAEDLP